MNRRREACPPKGVRPLPHQYNVNSCHNGKGVRPLLGATPRRGASLLEVMVVIAIGGVVMSLTGIVFHRLFQSEHVAARAALLERTTSRLAEQYRRDIHAAKSVHQAVSPDESLPTLELAFGTEGSSRVVYIGGADKVRRDAVSAAGMKTHETYRLPDCRISFSESDGEASGDSPKSNRMITLRIERPRFTSTSVPQVQRPMHLLPIDAELGRDDHLTGMTPASPGIDKQLQNDEKTSRDLP